MTGTENDKGKDVKPGMGRPRTCVQGMRSVSFLKAGVEASLPGNRWFMAGTSGRQHEKREMTQRLLPKCEMKYISHRLSNLIFKASPLK